MTCECHQALSNRLQEVTKRLGEEAPLWHPVVARILPIFVVNSDALEVRFTQLETRCKLAGITDDCGSVWTRPSSNAADDATVRLEAKLSALADKLDPVGAAALGSVSRKDFRSLCEKVQKIVEAINDHASSVDKRFQQHVAFEREVMEGHQLRAQAEALRDKELRAIRDRMDLVELRASNADGLTDIVQLRGSVIEQDKHVRRLATALEIAEDEIRLLKVKLGASPQRPTRRQVAWNLKQDASVGSPRHSPDRPPSEVLPQASVRSVSPVSRTRRRTGKGRLPPGLSAADLDALYQI